MRNLFGGGDTKSSSRGSDAGRTPRHSSGWNELLKYLRGQESLRILDIGPTSSTNINYITSLGHSIYMANVVEEASKPEWLIPGEPGEDPKFNVEGFLETNFNFSGRKFDVVILWDTADYLPEALLAPVFARIHQAPKTHSVATISPIPMSSRCSGQGTTPCCISSAIGRSKIC
jgi:hypothetical protein